MVGSTPEIVRITGKEPDDLDKKVPIFEMNQLLFALLFDMFVLSRRIAAGRSELQT